MVQVIATPQGLNAMEITWSYDNGEIPPSSVTVHEYGPDGQQMALQGSLASVGGVALFTNLKPNTTYRYEWCGYYPSAAGGAAVQICVPPVSQTILPQSPPAAGEVLTPPFITNLDPQPATIHQGNSITVAWSSTIQYDKFLVWWTENGIAKIQGEIDADGYSGSWTAAPTVPGASYTFAMNGGIGYTWGADYSGWGPTQKINAVPNLTSLRQFLQHSGLDPIGQHLRSLLPTGVTLKRFMKL